MAAAMASNATAATSAPQGVCGRKHCARKLPAGSLDLQLHQPGETRCGNTCVNHEQQRWFAALASALRSGLMW